MHPESIIITPPLLKSVNGPPLGPARLAGAARAAGLTTRLLDLNLHYLLERDPGIGHCEPTGFVGDHDRPRERLRLLQAKFENELGAVLHSPQQTSFERSSVLTLTYQHREVLETARAIAAGPQGGWIRAKLVGTPEPRVVGLSVLYSGQVVWALAISFVVRHIWPKAEVIWGGPHVTALEDEIRADERYGAAIDGFVFGHAEAQWIAILEAIRDGHPLPVTRAGVGTSGPARNQESLDAIPFFEDLHLYGAPTLTLPVQLSRGCPYGRCRFCTYPVVEGAYRQLPWEGVERIVELAINMGAAISLKDSLVLPDQLDRMAGLVDGRAPWSASTKLNPRFTSEFLTHLAVRGLRTLEIGLETLAPTGQRLFQKRQPRGLLTQLLDAAAEARISLVVNYMVGVPGVEPPEERRDLDWVRRQLQNRPRLIAHLEMNTMQLERLSPLGQEPMRHGLMVTKTWPWASVMAWEPLALARTLGLVGSG